MRDGSIRQDLSLEIRAQRASGPYMVTGGRVYFLVALLIGVSIGAAACLPRPHERPSRVLLSLTLGVAGACIGWFAGLALDMRGVGPFAQLFISVVAAGAIVSIYHAATSERPRLH